LMFLSFALSSFIFNYPYFSFIFHFSFSLYSYLNFNCIFWIYWICVVSASRAKWCLCFLNRWLYVLEGV
jgi:hypothetical protein